MKKMTQSFEYSQEMHSDTFQIFHYRDARLRDVPIHNHDFYEIYLFIHGDVDYRIESEIYSLQPSDLLVIPPGVFHQPMISPSEPYERIVLWISRNYMQQIIGRNDELYHCFNNHNHILSTQDEYGNLQSILQAIQQETVLQDVYDEDCARSLLNVLLIKINRISASGHYRANKVESNPVIEKVLSYINNNYYEDISLDSIANHFYLNKYYLSHLFTQQVGSSIYRYIIKKRLSYARELLQSGYSPNEACAKSGFSDYTNFYKAYREEYRMTPKQHCNKGSN